MRFTGNKLVVWLGVDLRPFYDLVATWQLQSRSTLNFLGYKESLA